jgi:hypothetical protein
MESEARNEEESHRLAKLLADLIVLSRRSVRSIEQQYGVGSSGLGKVLNGTVRLQAGHIFMILDALGMTPGQFFQLAYPRREKPHPLAAELRKTQGLAPAADDQELAGDFEERTRQVILRLFADVIRQEDPSLLESRDAGKAQPPKESGMEPTRDGASGDG